MENSWNVILILCKYRTNSLTNVFFRISLWITRVILIVYLIGLTVGGRNLFLACTSNWRQQHVVVNWLRRIMTYTNRKLILWVLGLVVVPVVSIGVGELVNFVTPLPTYIYYFVFTLVLYLLKCPNCGRRIVADARIWQGQMPLVYAFRRKRCPHCNQSLAKSHSVNSDTLELVLRW